MHHIAERSAFAIENKHIPGNELGELCVFYYPELYFIFKSRETLRVLQKNYCKKDCKAMTFS